MENFTLQDQSQTANVIKFKAKSLVSTTFPVTLNQVMIAKSVLQAKSVNLLLQKNVDLDKLLEIKTQQEQMRDMARDYLDQHLPKILALLTDITGFYNTFDGYYQDVEDYIDKLDGNDEDEKKDLSAVIAEILAEVISFIVIKKNKSKELIEILLRDNKKSALLSEGFNKTQTIAEQLYSGDKTEISALQNRIKEILKDIEQCNNQTASGALDSAKNILKISTTFIANYNKDKNPDPKPDQKPDEKPDPKPDVKELKSLQAANESTPIVENNLQLFSDNKPVPTFYKKKLQDSIALYRECIEKLQKYNSEATIFSVLMQQWDAFINSMVVIAGNIEYLANAWQELEQNFTTFKEKFSARAEDIDEKAISNIKEQWYLTQVNLSELNKKAIDFQQLAYLDVVKDPDGGRNITSYAFRALLNVPRIKNPRLMQRIISENSKE